MERWSSAEEVHDRHLTVLGKDLGSLYHALQNEVTWLHAKWLEYQKLYAKSPKRIDLLNETAGFFFRVLQVVLWEDVLLHLARLTDPPKSAGKDNLTINRLPTLLADRSLANDVQDLVKTAIQQCLFAREWRNRHLAHRDLHLAMESLQATPLPTASQQAVGNALDALAAVLNRVERHFFDSEVAFGHFHAVADADALVYYLTIAARYDERQRERLSQGRPLPEDLEPPPDA